MPNHFTSLGFDIVTQEDLKALAQHAASHAQAVHMKAHHYLRWVGSAGEELWLQIDETGDLIGMNPHFSGRSSVRVRLQSRVGRDTDTALDGAFIGWADPGEDMPESGLCPIVFDAPDAATYSTLKLTGFCPDFTDTSLKAHNGPGGCHETATQVFSGVQA